MRPATSRPCGWPAWWARTGRRSIPTCSRPRNIDTAGLQVVPGGKTFRWRGKYLPNMNDRETLDLQLNVLAEFDPVLPETLSPLQVPLPGQRLAQAAAARCSSSAPGRRWSWPTRWTSTSAPSRTNLRKLLEADRRPGAQRQRGEAADRRRQPRPGRPRGARDGPAVRGHQEGRARGDVLQRARDLRPAGLSHARRSSIRPARATVLPAA